MAKNYWQKGLSAVGAGTRKHSPRTTRRARAFVVFFLALALVWHPSAGLSRNSILLDAETTTLFRTYADPLIQAAGLQPHNIKVYLQNSSQVNAFASPGRIVLFSGLVLKTKTPGELQAVIAHEIAHIASGHIPTLVRQRKSAGLIGIASQIIGLGAIIAGLAPLGVLILAGGSSIAGYSALGETRTAEASADQAALSYLERTNTSGKGLVSFFRREFLPQEVAFSQAYRIAPNPYRRTHPLSSDRLNYLQTRVEQSKSYNVPTLPALASAHDMALAKLYGFSQTPQATLSRYRGNSMPARYARAVMYAYRLVDSEKSLALIDSLIADQPSNPFFHEFKGYVLSRVQPYGKSFTRAVASYDKALALAPTNLIMRLEIGNILVRSGKPDYIRQGIGHLKLARQDSFLAANTFRPLARGFGALGQIGLAELATAEALIVEGNPKAAKRHAKRALTKIPKSQAPARLRAQDIIDILSTKKNKGSKK